jgi:hypothetical protein
MRVIDAMQIEALGGEGVMMDADGLTRPMRELNAFAEEHALGQPFPEQRRPDGG